MSVWVRRLLAFACVLATWLVVRPAAASAPFCDEHAASATAPTPVLDLSGASVDVSEQDSGCKGWVGRDHQCQRGQSPSHLCPGARADFAPPDARVSVTRFAPKCAPRDDVPCPSAGGVRFLVERPPRSRRD